jgi:Holliday junction resolvase RusA-like endonuclease
VIIVLEGVNPEPWRSPRLGTKRVAGKVTPAAFKDANLRSYQEAVKEVLTEELTTLGYELPIFEEGSLLTISFGFWRQTESYQGEGRRNVRARPDLTNMQKATEDALQGVLYKTDRRNVMVQSALVEVGPLVEPRILIECELETASSWRHFMNGVVSRIKETGVPSPAGSVWTKVRR